MPFLIHVYAEVRVIAVVALAVPLGDVIHVAGAVARLGVVVGAVGHRVTVIVVAPSVAVVAYVGPI